MCILANGKIIKLMVKVFTFTRMDLAIPVIGMMIFSMGLVFKNG